MSFNGLLINFMKIVTIDRDKHSEPTKSISITKPCRIMYRDRLIRLPEGEEVRSVAKIFAKPTETINTKQMLQLSTENYTIDHPIVDVNKPQNSVAHHHTEIFIT